MTCPSGRLLLVFALLAACGDDTSNPRASAELARDVQALRRVITSDPAGVPLQEAEDAVADGRPVRAADLLSAGGLPAARSQVERVRALALTTNEGRALGRRVRSVYEGRVQALEEYRGVLERGDVQDMALVDALRAQRLADQALLDIDEELERLVPVQGGPRRGSARAGKRRPAPGGRP